MDGCEYNFAEGMVSKTDTSCESKFESVIRSSEALAISLPICRLHSETQHLKQKFCLQLRKGESSYNTGNEEKYNKNSTEKVFPVLFLLAEMEGFEPPRALRRLADFESAPFSHLGTSP